MENILLVWALLLFVAVVAGKLAYKFGAPALLLFLGVGMVAIPTGIISAGFVYWVRCRLKNMRKSLLKMMA